VKTMKKKKKNTKKQGNWVKKIVVGKNNTQEKVVHKDNIKKTHIKYNIWSFFFLLFLYFFSIGLLLFARAVFAAIFSCAALFVAAAAAASVAAADAVFVVFVVVVCRFCRLCFFAHSAVVRTQQQQQQQQQRSAAVSNQQSAAVSSN
jgi:fatty acid desaturase